MFGRAAIQVLKTYPDPEQLADADLSELAALLKESSQGRFSLDKACELKERAANSFGIRFSSRRRNSCPKTSRACGVTS